MPQVDKRLRLLRIDAKLTQAQVAKRLQVHPLSVASWETGRRNPSLDNVVSLAKLYKTTTDYILCVEDESVYIRRGLTSKQSNALDGFLDTMQE